MLKFYTLIFGILSSSVLAFSDPQLAYSLQKKGEAVIIDIREANELNQGMIKDAKWFPLSRLETNQNWPKMFKKLVQKKKVFLYCRSGRRVKKFQSALSKEKLPEGINLGGLAELSQVLPTIRP